MAASIVRHAYTRNRRALMVWADLDQRIPRHGDMASLLVHTSGRAYIGNMDRPDQGTKFPVVFTSQVPIPTGSFRFSAAFVKKPPRKGSAGMAVDFTATLIYNRPLHAQNEGEQTENQAGVAFGGPGLLFVPVYPPDDEPNVPVDFWAEGTLETGEYLGTVSLQKFDGDPDDPASNPVGQTKETDYPYQEPGFWCAAFSGLDANSWYQMTSGPWGGGEYKSNFHTA